MYIYISYLFNAKYLYICYNDFIFIKNKIVIYIYYNNNTIIIINAECLIFITIYIHMYINIYVYIKCILFPE